MSSSRVMKDFHFQCWMLTLTLTCFFHHCSYAHALNPDGVSLLSLKYNILSDPLSVLESWSYLDPTPCSWRGVTCGGTQKSEIPFQVTGVSLPNSQLSGSLPPDLGMIKHLHYLDLSNNFLNGSLPEALFNATELQLLSLANNHISGELSEAVGGLKALSSLNLSGNFFAGRFPGNLTALKNLTVVSLRSNFFSGEVPKRLDSVQVLDLSFNLFNGSLPVDFGGGRLTHMNLSHNNLSGIISPDSVKNIPANATIDLSFNNLTGAIPENEALWNQDKEVFAGNIQLCGKPLEILCSFRSPKSNSSSASSSSSPAIAVKPHRPDNPEKMPPEKGAEAGKKGTGMKPVKIAGIAIGDITGIGILALVVLSVYQLKQKRKNPKSIESPISEKRTKLEKFTEPRSGFSSACPCLAQNQGRSEETSENDSDEGAGNDAVVNGREAAEKESKRKLVMVDGGEMELDTLLRASAYVMGVAGRSIVYRAVLEDGTALAVRRMSGECGGGGGGGLREFENQVRQMGKLRHPNVVRVRGFYWGPEEKLLICDYVSNGSLAAISHRRHGSTSPYHLCFGVRLKIARGVARGLVYIHEKKHVHGNIKANNILLTLEMEPVISDFGLDRLFMGPNRSKSSGSFRGFDVKPTITLDGPQDLSMGRSPSMTGSWAGALCPYHAPESIKNVKPSPKWDVYSFGMVLLKLLTGKEFSEQELSRWTAGSGMDEKTRAWELVDMAIRAEVACRDDAMVACLKLGFGCASLNPQKRPSMKEALQLLERIQIP